ncbi:hypothetical protein DIPPA_09725 [Diplonema papillatum]|nr:hypothetical protein DIPPA_09725 [Diplonema papillatum]|eukprot:gene18224-28080_t
MALERSEVKPRTGNSKHSRDRRLESSKHPSSQSSAAPSITSEAAGLSPSVPVHPKNDPLKSGGPPKVPPQPNAASRLAASAEQALRSADSDSESLDDSELTALPTRRPIVLPPLAHSKVPLAEALQRSFCEHNSWQPVKGKDRTARSPDDTNIFIQHLRCSVCKEEWELAQVSEVTPRDNPCTHKRWAVSILPFSEDSDPAALQFRLHANKQRKEPICKVLTCEACGEAVHVASQPACDHVWGYLDCDVFFTSPTSYELAQLSRPPSAVDDETMPQLTCRRCRERWHLKLTLKPNPSFPDGPIRDGMLTIGVFGDEACIGTMADQPHDCAHGCWEFVKIRADNVQAPAPMQTQCRACGTQWYRLHLTEAELERIPPDFCDHNAWRDLKRRRAVKLLYCTVSHCPYHRIGWKAKASITDDSDTPIEKKPCEHNDWDDVRTRKGHKVLRCRACQSKWKLPSGSVSRCMAFLHGRCVDGASNCKFLHVQRKKNTIVERYAKFGTSVLVGVGPDVDAPQSKAPESAPSPPNEANKESHNDWAAWEAPKIAEAPSDGADWDSINPYMRHFAPEDSRSTELGWVPINHQEDLGTLQLSVSSSSARPRDADR